MIFIYEINNNILNYGAGFLCGYQDEYQKWDIYQKINNVWVGTKHNKTSETAVHYTHAIINIFKRVLVLWACCLKKHKYWWRNVHHKIGFFINFVMFNNDHVYSVIRNQSGSIIKYSRNFGYWSEEFIVVQFDLQAILEGWYHYR